MEVNSPPQISFLTFLLIIFSTYERFASTNPHAPFSLRWAVISLEDNSIIYNISDTKPLNTWWPDLSFCLKDVIPPIKEYAPRHVRNFGFYACPNYKKGAHCGTTSSYYCAKWSCVTSNDGNWKWSTPSSDLLSFSFTKYYDRNERFSSPKPCNNNRSDHITVKFTEHGKRLTSQFWMLGQNWGIVFYDDLGKMPGALIQVRLTSQAPSQPIGPNTVLSEQQPAKPEPTPPEPKPRSPQPAEVTLISLSATPSPPSLDLSQAPPSSNLSSGQRLLNLVQGAFQVLNNSNPNLTESCWLCLAATPPYYEGLTLIGNFSNQTGHSNCSWISEKRLTLTAISGSTGICIGTPQNSQQAKLCNQTLKSPHTSDTYYLIPPVGGWWACNTGLTPCVSTSVFNQSRDFCVMVQIFPKIIYHTEDNFITQYELQTTRFKREPISLTLAVLMGLGVAAGVSTGTATLIENPRQLNRLSLAIDEDLRAIEQSVSKLESSLTSLSEVVLQNRRGLDIIFLKEGGLCAALKEQCCFYSDHSGVIKDSMTKLRERLNRRQRQREANQGPFSFSLPRTSWLTNLLLSFVGPILGILLALSFGPWAFKKLTSFIKQQIDAALAKPIQVHYHRLAVDDEYVAKNGYSDFLPEGTA